MPISKRGINGPIRAKSVATGRRVIVADISTSEIFAGSPLLEVMLDARVRALQTTPIVGTRIEILGVLTTLWRFPYVPIARELRSLDRYATFVAAPLDRDYNGEHRGVPPGRWA